MASLLGGNGAVDELGMLHDQHRSLEQENARLRQQLTDMLQRDCKRLAQENAKMQENLQRVSRHWETAAEPADPLEYQRRQMEMQAAEQAKLRTLIEASRY